jgi:biofilm PGA synthesis N-glycosyltransferase PgaC
VSQRRRKRARWVSPDRGIRSSGAVKADASAALLAQRTE